jgi:hypothetical protein
MATRRLERTDKRRVLAAVVERITINRGVRGRSILGNRPEDRVTITWRSTICTAHTSRRRLTTLGQPSARFTKRVRPELEVSRQEG